MSAAEFSSFLDATLSGASEDPRLPTMRADGLPAFDKRRVIPSLMHDIVTSMQVRQRLHLKLLGEHLESLIEYDDSTVEETEMLLVMLFSFAHRRGGLTPLQKRHNNESSDLAFGILHRLLGTDHPKRALINTTLRELCVKLGSPPVVSMPSSPPPVANEYATILDSLSEQITKLDAMERSAREALQRQGADSANALLSTKVSPPVFEHSSPWSYMLHALPLAERRGMSEIEFHEVTEWFTSRKSIGSGDERDLTELLSRGAQIGSLRYVTAEQAASKLCHTAEGGVTLLDLLRFLFPLVPDRTLLKRCHGMILAPPSEDASHPPSCVAEYEAAAPEAYLLAQRISTWFAAGQPPAEVHRVIRCIIQWMQVMDFTHSGFVCGDCVVGGTPWDEMVRNMFARLRKTRMSVYDVMVQVFPGDRFQAVKGQFTLTLRTVEKEHVVATKYKQELNTGYKLALIKYVELHEGDVNPGGDASTAIGADGNIALRELSIAQWNAYRLWCEASLECTSMANELSSLKQQRCEAEALQRQDMHHASESQVEPIAGPEAPPPQMSIAGFQVNRSIFELEGFDDPATRCQLVDVLSSLDAADIPPQWFLKDPSCVRLYLPYGVLRCGAGNVYRDFFYCPPRPPIGGPWKGDHTLRLVTNITKGSDVKYRIMLEGYNFGINKSVFTVVVGHASRSLEACGQLESFGWPDGWDRSSVMNFGGGFERVTQSYNEQGFVVMTVTAHSLSKVGFSASAWLVVHGHGERFPISMHVEHV